MSFGRVMAEGVLAAALLTVAMLCLELFVPKFVSTSSRIFGLDERAFPDLGFSISVPRGWTTDSSDKAMEARSGEVAGDVSVRGFRITTTHVPFRSVRREAERIDTSRFIAHDLVSQTRGELDGHDTYTRELFVDGRRIEQVWVDLEPRVAGRPETLRVEFWSRAADDEAEKINSRILRTLEIR